MSDQPYQPDTWKVIIDGEIEDVYVKDDEVHVSGMCALSATEAVQFAEVLVRAAALLALNNKIWATRDSCFGHYPSACPQGCANAGKHDGSIGELCECRECR